MDPLTTRVGAIIRRFGQGAWPASESRTHAAALRPKAAVSWATVVSAGPGELLRLTSDDFGWLLDTEPTARAAIARDLADRLPER